MHFQTVSEFRNFLKNAYLRINKEIAGFERYLSISPYEEEFYRGRVEDLKHLKTIYERILNEILNGDNKKGSNNV